MKPDIMSDRVGGAVLITSAIIMFAGAALANFTLAQSQTGFGAEPEQLRVAIAANPAAWRLAETLILAAIIVTALGLVPVTSGFRNHGRSWARAGLVAFSISAVLGAMRRIVTISVETWAAVEGLSRDDTALAAFSRFGGTLGEWFTTLAFVAVALCGCAWTRRPNSGAIGPAFIVAGGAGLILHLVGVGIPAFIFLETGALGLVVLMRANDSSEMED